jgi:hypothetical protein
MIRDDNTEGAEWWLMPTVSIKALQGHAMSAIQLRCLQCCCGDKKLVKECNDFTCALWDFRPYRRPNETRPKGHVPTLDNLRGREDELTAFQPPTIKKQRRKRRTKLQMMEARRKELEHASGSTTANPLTDAGQG